MQVLTTVVIVGFLVGIGTTGALAHKGKLPEDALTLVRQASGLLAQDPGMSGETKERLEAALESKRPQGVDLDKVREALTALDRKDIPGARQLLLAAITPAGMPLPPRDVARASPSPSPPPAAVPVPVAPTSMPAAGGSMMETMKMMEPLRSRFAGTPAELGLLAGAVVVIGLGLFSLRGGREVTAR